MLPGTGTFETGTGNITLNGDVTIDTGKSFSSDNVDIDGGSIDGTTIGSSSALSGAFTTITASTSIDVTGANGIILQNDETITNSSDGTVVINGEVAAGTGSDNTSGVFKSNGNYDVTLKTGNSTTGLIKIADGTNGNITIEPHGTGKTIIYEEFDDTNSADIKGAEFVKEANSNKVNLIISGDLTVKGDIDPKALILNRNPGGTSSDFNQYAADDLILYNDGGELKIQYGTGGNNPTVTTVVTNATQQSTTQFLTADSTISWTQIQTAVTQNVNTTIDTSSFLTVTSAATAGFLTSQTAATAGFLQQASAANAGFLTDTTAANAGYIKNEAGAFSYSNLDGNPAFTEIQSGSFVLKLFPNGPLGADASVAYASDIPTNNNQLVNGQGFIKNEVNAFNYNNLINKPTIPENTSDLTNDSGFITSGDVTSSQWSSNDSIDAIYYGTGNPTSPFNTTAGNSGVGKVGIHTSSPDYPLDVQKGLRFDADPGWDGRPYGDGFYRGSSTYRVYRQVAGDGGAGTIYGSTQGASTISIRALGGGIWADGENFFATSDRRIKENITEVPDNLALETLRNIECYYYEYIDKVRKGNQKTIGFIAQQVKEHLPMAVSTQRSTIPNEMRLLEATWDGLNMSCDLTDVSGVNYEFYVSNDPSGNDEVRKCVYGNKDNTFTFDKQYNNVFCYGKKVYDLNILAKEKLFTLNFSATQEIDKIQQEEKTKLAAAEERISALETENATLKAQLNSIEARLAALEA